MNVVCFNHFQRWARCPPPIGDAILALGDLRTLLKSRNTAIFSGHVLRTRLDHLNSFLAIYVTGKGWVEAADYTATIIGQGMGCSQRLQKWGKNYIHDRPALPYHRYANSGRNFLLDNVKFVGELFAHVTGAGLHVSAPAIVDFVEKPEVVEVIGFQNQSPSIPPANGCRGLISSGENLRRHVY